MNNHLPNPPEQPRQKKRSQPKISSFFSKLNILFQKDTYFKRKQNIVISKSLKKPNYVLQNVSYIGGLIFVH
jgi:hypothetical protein